MIAVKMRDQDVVDADEPRRLGRSDDAARIAAAGIAGVDQDRLVRGGDNQGRAAAFRVDPVDIQGSFFCSRETPRSDQTERQREQHQETAAGDYVFHGE